MAKAAVNFKTETQLSTTGAVLSSVATGSGSVNVIRAVSFFNQSSSTVTVKVYRLLSTNSISDDNLMIQKDVPARKTWNAVELQGKVVAAGYEIVASASVDSVINAEADGVTSS